MTSIKEALKDLAQIEKKQAALVQERDAVQTADQKIAAAAAELEAQQAVIADLQTKEAQKQLGELRKRIIGLFAEYGRIADQLNTIKDDADRLAAEIDDLAALVTMCLVSCSNSLPTPWDM